MTQTPTIGFFRMLPLECKKLKQTGCLPAVVLCGLFAAAFPLANMLVRPEAFTTLPGDPLSILADANWQMIAMLNILLSICLCCIMYHTEFADRGIQKSETLPVKAHLLFLGKGTILAVSGIVVILTECAALGFCALHWFPAYTFDSSAAFALLKFAGFQWLMLLPTMLLMLCIASICSNMWTSLGIGIILTFTIYVFPQKNLLLGLLPFSTPYHLLSESVSADQTLLYPAACAAETILFALCGAIYPSIRRYHS